MWYIKLPVFFKLLYIIAILTQIAKGAKQAVFLCEIWSKPTLLANIKS